MTIWGWIALIAILGGAVAAYAGRPDEGIGAPTRTTLAGVAATVAGLGIAGWRLLVGMGYWLSHG